MTVPPTFVAGDVLTAAQMNAVGQWLVTSGSFTAVTAVNVNNCFTSSYRNYRVQVHITAAAGAAQEIAFNLRVSASNGVTSYYNSRTGATYAAVSTIENINNSTRWFIGRSNGSTSIDGEGVFDIIVYAPQLAVRTFFGGTAADGSYAAVVGGYHDVETGYDGFSLNTSSNVTGIYRVYGLRD